MFRFSRNAYVVVIVLWLKCFLSDAITVRGDDVDEEPLRDDQLAARRDEEYGPGFFIRRSWVHRSRLILRGGDSKDRHGRLTPRRELADFFLGHTRIVIYYSDRSGLTPIFGNLYRSGAFFDKPGHENDYAVFTKLPPNYLPESVRESVSVTSPFIIPLRHDHRGLQGDYAGACTVVGYDTVIYVKSIDPPKMAKESPVATVVFCDHESGRDPASAKERSTLKMREGDVISAGEFCYRIKKIVVPQPIRINYPQIDRPHIPLMYNGRVTGWLELDPIPVEMPPNSIKRIIIDAGARKQIKVIGFNYDPEGKIGLSGIGKSKGKLVARGLSVQQHPHFQVKETDFVAKCPSLVVGDAIPMFGHMYRLADLTAEKMTIAWEGKPELQSIKPQFDSFTICVGGSGTLYQTSIHARSVAQDGKKTLATIELRGQDESKTVAVRQGEDLEIDGFRHAVRRIVPKDVERGIVGWIEISPIPATGTPQYLQKFTAIPSYHRGRPFGQFLIGTENLTRAKTFLRVKPRQKVNGTRNKQLTAYTLHTGDVIPMCNTLFRVKEIIKEKDGFVRVEWVGDLGDKSLSIDRNSLVIPYDGTLFVDNSDIKIKEFQRDDHSVTIGSFTKYSNGKSATSEGLTAGDRFKVGVNEYKIRNIVFPNKERKIIGWVELELQPIKDGQAKPPAR